MTDTLVLRTRGALADARAKLPGRVAVVPTMGALHAGHAALLAAARARADHVLATIFVNPLQFGPSEDFARYPRTLDADLAILREAGVEAVFAPSVEVMYPAGEPTTRVRAGAAGTILEGAHRPGHFDGVLTVVLKILNLTQPDLALFGEKDFQQLTLIRTMVADFDLPVQIVGAPTVRESDGLARSSRNRYLSPDDRQRALGLSRALRAGAARAQAGGTGAEVLAAAHDELAAATDPITVDYLALTGLDLSPDPGPGPARLLIAAKIGSTRLIDNLGVTLE